MRGKPFYIPTRTSADSPQACPETRMGSGEKYVP